MPKVLLGVIGNGRKALLDKTLASLKENVNYPFLNKIMINDTGRTGYALQLEEQYAGEWHIISHQFNEGLSGSIRSLWAAARLYDVDYIFHVEEDFTFNRPIDIESLIDIIDLNEDKIAQIALKRQPCNPAEIEAGGFMQQDPDSYSLYHSSYKNNHVFREAWFVTHRNFFTLNPCLYPRWVIDLGWEQGWGEKEFGERLFADENARCAYLGKIDDSPLVTHIGDYRGDNWFV